MTSDDYILQVEQALSDLPWSQRRDLIADLRQHLGELPPETDLETRLGTPERYAADLRAVEGLEPRTGVRAYLRARRPRNVILVSLFAVVVSVAIGLSIGALVWIDSYQPIAMGNQAQSPLDSKPSSGETGVTVLFRKGRPFLYGATIQNNGRFSVRILGVPRGITDYFKARLYTNKPNPAVNERPLVPFRPFDLHPGEERWLVLKGVYACTAGSFGAGGGTRRDTIPVRFKFLWKTETTYVPVMNPLAIVFPKKNC